MSYGTYYRNRYGRGMAEPAVFNSLNNVQKLFETLEKKIEQNGYVTMADYYEAIRAVVLPDDSKWGWTNLLESTITRTRRGFELSMPPTTCVRVDPIQKAYDSLCEAESAEPEDIGGFVEDAKSYLSSVL